jgi:mannosylglycerate hydrolase
MTDLASEPSPGPVPVDGGTGPTVRRVDVVPHTHWDREWYSPYPTFRLRLVDLLDELLPRLESDPAFAHFQLDGQMAVVDDYLGLRPHEAPRLRRLAAEGRLSMGPWYVLPDEFLVSGETHVRNLQLGLRRAEEFGGAMPVGYLPDMFGHVAQMPQLLVQFGFTDAVVWRGVPSTIDAPQFWWVAPDGSRVRTEYLPAGYGNGSELPRDPAAVREKIEVFRLLQGPLVGDPLLLMAGMDHEVPPAHLTSVIAAVNEIEAARTDGDRYELTIRSLAEHLAEPPSGHLPELRGEMRSGFRANVLMGVASNRVDVKQAAARAERTLERVAEPLAALWLGEPERWRSVFDAAWLDVIRNAAHDSICACSHDEVVDAVLHRYAESTRLAEGVADRAVAAAAARMASPGVVVLNATARTRTDVVEIDIPGSADGEPVEHPAIQVLSTVPEVEEVEGATGEEAPMRLALAALAEHPDTRSVRVEDGGGSELVAHLLPDPPSDEAMSSSDALALVGRRVAEDPGLALRLVVHRRDPSRHVLTLAGDVPGYGWARWEPVEPVHPVRAEGDLGLSNGLVTVVADTSDGTFSVDGLAGFGRLVDDGDAGDTYNWCPPEHDVVVDAPTSVEVVRTEAGPIRGRLVIRSTYVLPERCAIDGRDEVTTGWAGFEPYRRVGEVTQVFTTTVEVRADDPTVRVTTAWDQRARDHRLRVHLPLPSPAATSRAEDAYAVVERALWIEGGPNEWGVPTFPSRRFVQAGGLTVTHEGLCEYELVDLVTPGGERVPDTTGMTAEQGARLGRPLPEGTTARGLALTIARSTGWLSRGPMPSRPQPAGPFDRLEGSQMLRPMTVRYAVRLDGDEPVDPYALADHVWNPLLPTIAAGGGDLGDRGSMLVVDGAGETGSEGADRGVRAGALEIDAVLRDEGGHLVVRAHATGDRGAVLALPGRSGAVVDLRGRELDTFTSVLEVDPHRIVTVRLD